MPAKKKVVKKRVAKKRATKKPSKKKPAKKKLTEVASGLPSYTLPKEPLWKGPVEDGITQSLLSNYLVCPERFHVKAIEGLKPNQGFNKNTGYGDFWHLCEEIFAGGGDWKKTLKMYASDIAKKYIGQPREVAEVEKWYNVCIQQFPIYIEYWKNDPDVLARVPLMQEVSFAVPYKLPSGRVILLRGKWDSTDWIGTKKNGGIYLQENKTKGQVDPEIIAETLIFDLQTQLYLTALETHLKQTDDNPAKDLGYPNRIKGIRYNVIRRPLSGGKGSIRQHQPSARNPRGESLADYYNRLGGVIEEHKDTFFYRWKVEILPGDLKKFADQTLNPVLENLYDDWEWWNFCKLEGKDRFDYMTRIGEFPHHTSRHYRLPYGIYNVVAEGRLGDLDKYLNTGSIVGLHHSDDLFPELD